MAIGLGHDTPEDVVETVDHHILVVDPLHRQLIGMLPQESRTDDLVVQVEGTRRVTELESHAILPDAPWFSATQTAPGPTKAIR